MIVLGGELDPSGRKLIGFELAHRFVDFYYPSAPVWMREGLAQYYSTITVNPDAISIGLPVPEIYAVAPRAGGYLEEDLGETTLFDALSLARAEDPEADFPAAMVPVYRRILELLPRFQVQGGKVVDYSVAYPRAAFDRQSILWDLNYFKYHFLKLAHVPFNEARLEKD